MGFKLYASRTDRIRFITSVDDAVQTDTEEQKETYKAYLETLDESKLTLTGKPVVWILRPLTMATLEIASRDARGLAIKGVYIDLPTARELVRLSVDDVENWPASEWGKRDACMRFEYKHKCLSPEFADRLPPGMCLEAAKVLLDSLPLEPGGDDPIPFAVASGAKSA